MKNKLSLKIITIILILTMILSGCSAVENVLRSNEENTNTEGSSINNQELDITGYASIDVDGGDLSGNREANVVVNIGFGDRRYYICFY